MLESRRGVGRVGALALAVALLCGVGLAACGDDSTEATDSGVDASPTDAQVDAASLDAADRECTSDDQCPDDVACTRDICDLSGRCRHPVDPGACDDGLFCNGVEICDPIHGCMPGPPETCTDDDVCTIDRCDEEAKLCRRSPRDFDEDGEADWHCAGGTDCDDRDPNRGMTFAEICADGMDNDCDGEIDEADCGRPPHDLCDDALDVSAGGGFLLNSEGASGDYSLTCGGMGRKDLVLSLTLTEPKDVMISADGSSVTWVAVRTTCEDRTTEFECQSGFPGTVRSRALAAGTYFVVVADSGGEVNVDVEVTPTSPAPTNSTCASPLDVSAGGVFHGSFVDVGDDVSTSCGYSGSPDLTYTFTIDASDAPRDVVLSAVAGSGDTLALAVGPTCNTASSELRCVRGSPAGTRLHQLAAGTYSLVVEGPSYREVDFDLSVLFEAPTPVPAGDTCASPLPLTAGTPVVGTLGDKEDDLDTTCGYSYRDAVYSFDLAARSDVTVQIDGSGSYVNVSVRPDCVDSASQIRCVSGSPARASLRDLPAGTYYAIVESSSGSGFTLNVTVVPPTPSVAVSGNESCGDAYVVPPTGGLFTGDTTTMLADLGGASCGAGAESKDAVFSLTLTEPRHVVATTDGSSFDTVLHVHQTSCGAGTELACDDDGGDGVQSLVDRVFDAGTWFFVVDGFGTSSAGAYTFEITTSAP